MQVTMPMSVTCIPPMAQWLAQPAAANHHAGQTQDTSTIVIATGHQAWLWHPGILAKDIAAVQYSQHLKQAPAPSASQRSTQVIHWVVDHDVLESVGLEVPILRDGKLTAHRLVLGPHLLQVPTGAQPAIDGKHAARQLQQAAQQWGNALLTDLLPLEQAWADQDVAQATTLADQMTRVIKKFLPNACHGIQWVNTTTLCQTDSFCNLVDQMLHDARNCVIAYNRAATDLPQAGIALLHQEPDRVELPLWAIAWQRPRLRVYADLADRKPMLTLEDGSPLTDQMKLAPKALTLTATIRSSLADLFIHGQGGHVYDQVTQHWWSHWLNQPLAPMAAVSVDMFLTMPAPLASHKQVTQAVWWAHHLKHNLDRHLLSHPEKIKQVTLKHTHRSLGHVSEVQQLHHQKTQLIQQMTDKLPRQHKQNNFKQIHQINDTLANAYPQILAQAQEAVSLSQTGQRNYAIAQKRDWFFALYGREAIGRLLDAFATEMDCFN